MYRARFTKANSLTAYKRIAYSLLCLVGSVALPSCTIPPKTLVPIAPWTEKIASLAISLEQPMFTPTEDALATLEREGWSNGQMGKKFCEDLASRLKASGITAYCATSMWGLPVSLSNASSQTASHTISIKPIRLHYVVKGPLGATAGPGFNPVFETLTRITNTQNGSLIWAAEISANFAPVDSTGARRYANDLIKLLQTAGVV